MPNIEPIYDFVFTDHALAEMSRRDIGKEDVRKVLASLNRWKWFEMDGQSIRRNLKQASR